MKVHFKDYKNGELKIEVENKDDLWYLSQIVDEDDLISAKTQRKIKIGDSENAKVIKKWVFLEIKIEKKEFHSFSGDLRLSGKITKGNEDIPQGQYHTINVEIGTVLSILKKKFYKYQIEKIEESQKNKYTNILIAAIDRGEATFALLKKYGYEIINQFEGEVEHKVDAAQPKNDFFKEAVNVLSNLERQYEINQIILASPSVWAKNLSELVKESQLKSRIIYSTCNSGGNNAISECLKRDEVKDALKNERASIELEAVESLLFNISIGKKYAYGFDSVLEKTNMGATEILLVTDNLIKKKKEKNEFLEIEVLFKSADDINAKIIIVSSENEAGIKLDSLGGIAAILRYDTNY
jgi:protein pelota